VRLGLFDRLHVDGRADHREGSNPSAIFIGPTTSAKTFGKASQTPSFTKCGWRRPAFLYLEVIALDGYLDMNGALPAGYV
jgi:hypothetical protein